MAIITQWYTVDNKEGVDLNNVQPVNVTTNPEYPGPSAKLGDRVQGNAGSEWVFVQASVTVTRYNAVCIDGTSFRAFNMTSALVASNVYSYGIAEFQTTQANGAGANGDYFWALLKANGGVAVNISPSAGRGVNLFISAVDGAFTSSVTSNAINSIELVVSIGTSASGPGEAVIRDYMWASKNVYLIGAVGSA